jgi:hypothetical protein
VLQSDNNTTRPSRSPDVNAAGPKSNALRREEAAAAAASSCSGETGIDVDDVNGDGCSCELLVHGNDTEDEDGHATVTGAAAAAWGKLNEAPVAEVAKGGSRGAKCCPCDDGAFGAAMDTLCP